MFRLQLPVVYVITPQTQTLVRLEDLEVMHALNCVPLSDLPGECTRDTVVVGSDRGDVWPLSGKFATTS